MNDRPIATRSARTRIVLRVVGAVLLLAGIFLAIRGGMAFADEMNAASSFEADDSGFGSILTLAGGLFLVVFGIGALNAGFLGAQARYASGETAPAVRELGSAFRGEASRSETPVGGGGGPFCSSCGVRADRDAKFCDACGHGLVPR